jgi:hypothetical protein
VLDLVLAVLVVAAAGAAGLGLLVALTVVPFVVTLQRADRRGVAGSRAGGLALAGSGVALALALLLAVRSQVPLPVAVLPLLLVGLGPLAVAAAPGRLGRRGRHEPGRV